MNRRLQSDCHHVQAAQPAVRRGNRLGLLGTVALCMCGVLAGGCTNTNESANSRSGEFISRGEMDQGLLKNALDILTDLDQFEQESALTTVVDRLNQWIDRMEPLPDWQLDPVIETLPPALRKLPQVSGLPELRFAQDDGFNLREVRWLRDIARHAVGDEIDARQRAWLLFDWTVRNIQLEPDSELNPEWTPHTPWELLLLGRGTAEDRAWLFVLLGRQLGLDIVVLAVPERDIAGPAPEPARQPDSGPSPVSPDLRTIPQGMRLWTAALVDPQRKELYLFDPRLGLPLPGPNAQGVPRAEEVASLNQVIADDGLLRRLDLADGEVYPFRSSEAARAVALVEAAPVYLAQRTSLLESRLPGAEQQRLAEQAADLPGESSGLPTYEMVLGCRPSHDIEMLSQGYRLAGAQLWPIAFVRLHQQHTLPKERIVLLARKLRPFFQPTTILSKARVLHLTGRLSGRTGAGYYYQGARPAEADLTQFAANQEIRQILRWAKQSATYWLGHVAYELDNDESARYFLQSPAGSRAGENPWRHGARYLLARIDEAEGMPAQAMERYRNDDSPQRHGNRLRAQWLESAGESPTTADKDSPAPANDR